MRDISARVSWCSLPVSRVAIEMPNPMPRDQIGDDHVFRTQAAGLDDAAGMLQGCLPEHLDGMGNPFLVAAAEPRVESDGRRHRRRLPLNPNSIQVRFSLLDKAARRTRVTLEYDATLGRLSTIAKLTGCTNDWFRGCL